MYDPTLDQVFSAQSNDSQTLEWYQQSKDVEPIWSSNQKAGGKRRSAAEWFGANIEFNNQSIIYIPYNSSIPYNELIDTFIRLFTDSKDPINFGAMYFDQPGLF